MVEKFNRVGEKSDENEAIICDPSSVDDDSLLEAAKSYPEDAIIIGDDERRRLYP